MLEVCIALTSILGIINMVFAITSAVFGNFVFTLFNGTVGVFNLVVAFYLVKLRKEKRDAN